MKTVRTFFVKLLMILACCDLVSASLIFWPAHENTLACHIQASIFEFSWISSYLWMLCISATMYFTVVRSRQHMWKYELLYHVICWGIPTVGVIIMNCFRNIVNKSNDDSAWCWLYERDNGNDEDSSSSPSLFYSSHSISQQEQGSNTNYYNSDNKSNVKTADVVDWIVYEIPMIVSLGVMILLYVWTIWHLVNYTRMDERMHRSNASSSQRMAGNNLSTAHLLNAPINGNTNVNANANANINANANEVATRTEKQTVFDATDTLRTQHKLLIEQMTVFNNKYRQSNLYKRHRTLQNELILYVFLIIVCRMWGILEPFRNYLGIGLWLKHLHIVLSPLQG
ncbi:cAMP receptor-like protein [Reticulomyxa filosa]|uniref:cAMP receptor-like protein n=1 Tax=Reticulomyxa filosa TaxID=46433 RepID=X6P9Z5_RETFI|nr:cAMP receptor-like protein [Reticulomyxa filosa]|eukprot:ETO34467.1 cAMP receptor-like protein [Reticulomyxa filosa]